MLICFEGLDGSGKDTAICNLNKAVLNEQFPRLSKYQNTLITREPTNLGESGKKIISFLTNEIELDNQSRLELYINNRIEHSAWIRALQAPFKNSFDMMIFCSRYDLSTFAYQGAYGADPEDMYRRHNYNSDEGAIIPQLTFFLSANADTCLERIKKRKEQSEYFETLDKLKKISDSYINMIDFLRKKDNRKIEIIDAARTPEQVNKDILSAFSKLLE